MEHNSGVIMLAVSFMVLVASIVVMIRERAADEKMLDSVAVQTSNDALRVASGIQGSIDKLSSTNQDRMNVIDGKVDNLKTRVESMENTKPLIEALLTRPTQVTIIDKRSPPKPKTELLKRAAVLDQRVPSILKPPKLKK